MALVIYKSQLKPAPLIIKPELPKQRPTTKVTDVELGSVPRLTG